MLLLLLWQPTERASAFTQSAGPALFGFVVPMGHEWITRMAAAEVLRFQQGTAPDLPDPDDPRRGWRPGTGASWNPDVSGDNAQAEVRRIRANPTDEDRYASRYKAVLDAIVGERWVDIGGYSIANARACWDAVAQEPAEVQYDHAMRRYDDVDGGGGVRAITESRARFVTYFVQAATAPRMTILVSDGGIKAEPAAVDHNYFLFGRSLHLLQDSFSSEHTVRIAADNHLQVREIKSYMCALGSEQHTHDDGAIFAFTSGDVIWRVGTQLTSGWKSYRAASMKTTALLAVEASKDAWAAFIRTMALPPAQRAAAARAEAQQIADHWMSFDEPALRAWYDNPDNRGPTYVLGSRQSGKGSTQQACMVKIGGGTTDPGVRVRQLEAVRRKCLYNALAEPGYGDAFDPQLRLWYNWKWRNGATMPMSEPRPGWSVSDNRADRGRVIRILSRENGKPMTAPSGVKHDSPILVREGAPLNFAQVDQGGRVFFRSTADPQLFLDYWVAGGALKLYSVPNFSQGTYGYTPPDYTLGPAGGGTWIKSNYWTSSYIWLDGDTPRLTSRGAPSKRNSQWELSEVP